ncbi:MAG: DUF4251 domain-containing protein [Rikenellaceae bacterium]
MKGKFLLLAMLTLMATSTSVAQKLTHQQRVEQREEKQQAYTAKIKEAFAQQRFTFIAMQMQTNFGPITTVPGVNDYIDVYPSDLDVNLPYQSTYFTTIIRNEIYFTTISYTFDVQYSSDGKSAFVDIQAKNVIDMQTTDGMDASQGNLNYSIRMQVSMLSGAATVTITPTFGNQMQYIGTLQLVN